MGAGDRLLGGGDPESKQIVGTLNWTGQVAVRSHQDVHQQLITGTRPMSPFLRVSQLQGGG